MPSFANWENGLPTRETRRREAGLMRAVRGLLLCISAVSFSSSALASQPTIPQGFSFILRDHPGFANNPEFITVAGAQPNTIFIYDPATKLAIIGSTDLDTAIANQLGPGVRVDALTYGADRGKNRDDPNALFYWSIQLDSNGDTGAAKATPIIMEYRSEVESDIYSSRNELFNVTSRVIQIPKKIADENTASNVPSVFTGNPVDLGLHGKIGFPSGAALDDRSNVAALSTIKELDYGQVGIGIYFSIDAMWTDGVTTYYPGDILLLDSNGIIQLFIHHTAFGLGPLDNVDAIAMDLFYSVKLGYPTAGWLSLDRASPYLNTGPTYGAADIFEFLVATPTIYLHRTAEANGLFRAVGEIDGIVSIDPPVYPFGSVRDIEGPTGEIDIEFVAPRGQVQLRVGEFVFPVQHAVGQLFPGFPLMPGTLVVVELASSISNAIIFPLRVEVPSAVPPVQNLRVEEPIPGVQQLVWDLPPAPYIDQQVTFAEQTVVIPGGLNVFPIPPLPADVYDFSVQGFNALGQSVPQGIGVEINAPPAAPESPIEVGTQPAGTDIVVTWEASLAGPVATDFEILVDRLPIGSAPAGSTDFTFTPAAPGLYEIAVRALNLGVASAPSAVYSFLTRPEPGEIVQLQPIANNGAITYHAASNTLFVVQGSVAQRVDPNFVPLGPIPTPSLDITGIAAAGDDLYWLEGATGVLYRTNLAGVLQSTMLLAGACGDCTGDITFDGTNLWVVDRGDQLYRAFDLNGLSSGFELPMPPAASPNAALGLSFHTAAGVFIATTGSTLGTTESISYIDAGGTLLDSVDGTFGPAGGIAYVPAGSSGFPSIYVAQGNSVREFALIDPVSVFPRIDCHTLVAGGLAFPANVPGPLNIPDNDPIGVDSSVAVNTPNAGSVADVDVEVEIRHGFVGNLRVTLTSPSGVSIDLHDRSGGDGADLVGRYDDLNNRSGMNDQFGSLVPDGPGSLADFEGEAADGNWTLSLADESSFGAAGGLLNQWQLLLCVGNPPSTLFLRGDCNGDGQVLSLTDTLFLLNFLFTGGATPPCNAACDSSGSNQAPGLVSAIYLLNFGFNGGPPPPAPFPSCGVDNATVSALGCDSPTCP